MCSISDDGKCYLWRKMNQDNKVVDIWKRGLTMLYRVIMAGLTDKQSFLVEGSKVSKQF